jgi:hypothetical protein
MIGGPASTWQQPQDDIVDRRGCGQFNKAIFNEMAFRESTAYEYTTYS